jgi:hypothetical protein
MAVSTSTAILASAAVTALAAGTTASQQHTAARRARTRQRGIAEAEARRQREQSSLLAAQEKQGIAAANKSLRGLAGRRSGRRSLLFGSELGVPAQANQGTSSRLGQKQSLGK